MHHHCSWWTPEPHDQKRMASGRPTFGRGPSGARSLSWRAFAGSNAWRRGAAESVSCVSSTGSATTGSANSNRAVAAAGGTLVWKSVLSRLPRAHSSLNARGSMLRHNTRDCRSRSWPHQTVSGSSGSPPPPPAACGNRPQDHTTPEFVGPETRAGADPARASARIRVDGRRSLTHALRGVDGACRPGLRGRWRRHPRHRIPRCTDRRSSSRLRGERNTAYVRARQHVGRVILLGLEVLIIADIVQTITIDPTLEGTLTLALIVLVRTFLSFSLEVELDGVVPGAGAAPQRTSPSGMTAVTTSDSRARHHAVESRRAILKAFVPAHRGTIVAYSTNLGAVLRLLRPLGGAVPAARRRSRRMSDTTCPRTRNARSAGRPTGAVPPAVGRSCRDAPISAAHTTGGHPRRASSKVPVGCAGERR